MAQFEEGKSKFIEPSKVEMPAWRTVLVISYAIWLLLSGFVSGRVKRLFAKK
jgi:hypothetical protein